MDLIQTIIKNQKTKNRLKYFETFVKKQNFTVCTVNKFLFCEQRTLNFNLIILLYWYVENQHTIFCINLK